MEPLTFLLLLAGLVGAASTDNSTTENITSAPPSPTATVNTNMASLPVNPTSSGNVTSATPSQTTPGIMTSPPLNATSPKNVTSAPPLPPSLNATSPQVNMTTIPHTSPGIVTSAPPTKLVSMTSVHLNATLPEPVNMTAASLSTPSMTSPTVKPLSPDLTSQGTSILSNVTFFSTTTKAAAPTTTTTAAPAQAPKINLGFKLQETFSPELANKSSPAFKQLESKVTEQLNSVYSKKFGSSFKQTVINSFSQGSIVVDAELIFNNVSTLPNISSAVATLTEAVASPTFNLSVNTSSISAKAVTIAPTEQITTSSSTMNPSTTPATANATNATSNAATTLGSNTTAATTVGSNTTAATTVSPNTTTTSTTVTTLPTTTTSTASTDPPTASQGALGLIFSLSQTFTADLANSSSSAFQALAQKVTNEVNAACKRVYGSSFLRSFVKSFRSGSVVTDMTLVFQDKASVPTVNNLTTELAANINSSSLNIIPGSLNATELNITTTPTTASNITTAATTAATAVVSNTTAATTVSPNTTTTSTTVTTLPTTTTSTASTDPPTASQGALGLIFSLSQTFTADLANSSSSAFQALAQKVTNEINRLVKNVFGSFLRSRVNSFKNGSVVVDMTLVFQNQSSVPSLTNATTALTQALQNTTLGIIEGSIRVSSSTSLQSTIGIWALTLLTVAQIMINM
nr:mucin-5AC isoform X1 [Maylandia zebra]